ncbi:MAG: hypothetical protein ACXAB2_16090 [Candidatus Hodarchaeales archaeon]|jgi:predicted class III extradiol MEMO1 family dioxygenase
MMKRTSQHAGSWYAGSESTLKAQLHDLFTDKRFGYGQDPLESSKDRSSNPNRISACRLCLQWINRFTWVC